MHKATAHKIRKLLPASEADVRRSLPRVGPDAIAQVLRRWKRRGQVIEKGDGVFFWYERPADHALPPTGKPRGSRLPPVRTASKTCRTCGVTYDSVFRYFGRSNRPDCFNCRPLVSRKARSRRGVTAPAKQLCRACQRTLPAAEFPTDLRYRSGLSLRCKDCTPGMVGRAIA